MADCSHKSADYSIRWRNIKRTFTQKKEPVMRPTVFGSRQRKGEQAIWQRRFWEHRIRTESDFNDHIDYIHYNPVNHGLVMRPVDWQYSSIYRYIQQGILMPDWVQIASLTFQIRVGWVVARHYGIR